MIGPEAERVRNIMTNCSFCSIATVEGGQPRVRPVSAFPQDDLSVLVASFSRARKMAQIAKDPRVELLFVDDSHAQVRIEGTAHLVESVEEKGRLMDGTLSASMWKKYFKGPQDPNFGLLRVEPSRIEWNETGEVKYRTLELG